MNRWWLLMIKTVLTLVLASQAMAAEVAVPDALKPWREWALHGEEFRRCPLSHGHDGRTASAFACVWYGSLQLDVAAGGARFSLPVEVLNGEPTRVLLPGDSENWPRDISDGVHNLPVINMNGSPAVLLPAGRTSLQGSFRWRQTPGELELPPNLALLQWTLNGKPVATVQREGNALVLSADSKPATVQDTLNVRVYQRVRDGIPLELDTLLRITVTGSAREVVLGQALQTGFVPTAMTSKLGARLDEQGMLRLQVRAGEWELGLTSRAAALPESLTLRADNGLWPKEEIWSWQSDERLRAASVEGAAPIDPGQADVPDDWQYLPAMLVRAGETLKFSERSRGRQVTDNALTLQRDLWLRFDGSGYSFRDQLSGSLRRDWRLDMAAPYQLQNVSDSGTVLPISVGQLEGSAGVELRTGDLDLRASGELTRSGTLPASGWQTRFDSAAISLHLPPGYRLLAATGVDEAPGSFVERWNLLDTFVLVLTAVLVFKLFGAIWAVLMLIAFAVLFHEPGMPVWLLPNAALAMLACRYASGKLGLWLQRYRVLSLVALMLLLVPFAAGQFSALLHPQLEVIEGGYRPSVDYGPAAYDEAAPAAVTMKPAPMEEVEQQARRQAMEEEMQDAKSKMAERIEVTGSRIKRSDIYQSYAENTINQSGKGIPNWQWHSYRLSWSGPIDPDQGVTLWLLSYPLRVLVVLLAFGIFAGFFVRVVTEWTGKPLLPLARSKLGFSAWLLPILLGGALLQSPVATAAPEADMPSTELLNNLKERLTLPPTCAPSCAELRQATVRATPTQLTVTLDVLALVPTTVPVPGRSGDWQPTQVQRNGERSVARLANGGMQVWVPAGNHQLVLSGPTPGSDRLSLVFAMKPGRINLQLDGWEASGVQADMLPSGSLALSRASTGKGSDDRGGLTQLSVPPFVRVERTLSFADVWRVDTTVTRIAPVRGAFKLNLPLLSGEAVQDDSLKVENGIVQLDFSADADRLTFSATLARAETLQLQSPADAPYVEIWQLAPDNQWRVQAEGTPQISSEDNDDWLQTYAPRPAEALTVQISRPVIATGATLAIDAVGIEHSQGLRSGNGNLTLQYRATQGGEQAIRLPGSLEVLAVELDGRNQSVRPRDGVLTVPVLPGTHSLSVQYRSNDEITVAQGLPAFALGVPAANLNYSLQMPDNRWILYTSGPTLGPAVLYWSALLVFIVLAFALARSRLTDVGFRDWLLLGLGLSTVSWGLLALLVLWFVLVRWRQQQTTLIEHNWFNVKQVALLALSGFAVLSLVGAVPKALLSSPDMMLTGNNSWGNQLHWFADYSSDALPAVTVLSVPMWLYKGAMLLWAIWLSFALLRWVKLAWQAVQVGGFWHSKPAKPARQSVGGESAPVASETPPPVS